MGQDMDILARQVEVAREELRQLGLLLNSHKTAVNDAADAKRALDGEISLMQREYSPLFSRHQRAAADANREAREETEAARKDVSRLAVLAAGAIAAGEALAEAAARAARAAQEAAQAVESSIEKARSAANGAQSAALSSASMSAEALICVQEARQASKEAQDDRVAAKELLEGSREALMAAKASLESREASILASHEAQAAQAKHLDEQRQRIRSELAMLASAKSMK